MDRYVLSDNFNGLFSLETGSWLAGTLPLSLVINKVCLTFNNTIPSLTLFRYFYRPRIIVYKAYTHAIQELDYDAGNTTFSMSISAFDTDDKVGRMTLVVTVLDANDNK